MQVNSASGVSPAWSRVSSTSGADRGVRSPFSGRSPPRLLALPLDSTPGFSGCAKNISHSDNVFVHRVNHFRRGVHSGVSVAQLPERHQGPAASLSEGSITLEAAPDLDLMRLVVRALRAAPASPRSSSTPDCPARAGELISGRIRRAPGSKCSMTIRIPARSSEMSSTIDGTFFRERQPSSMRTDCVATAQALPCG